MRAVHNVLQSLSAGGRLFGQRVLIHTDNQGVFYILNKAGSRSELVHKVCVEIFQFCLAHSIELIATWVPREQNALADTLSKEVQSCDWQLNRREFASLSHAWGPFDVDLFASHTNHLVPNYYSFYHTPTTSGVNAFAFAWGRRCWCNPPFAIVARVLQHAEACQARMCMILPFWPQHRWWPLLLASARVFAPFVHGCTLLTRAPDLFLGAAFGNTRACHLPAWETLALLLDFSAASASATRLPDCLACMLSRAGQARNASRRRVQLSHTTARLLGRPLCQPRPQSRSLRRSPSARSCHCRVRAT